jgi:antirestriction protein ArdC
MDTHPNWADLLQSAVNEPGTISAAYSQFHQFSIGNQILAWIQCRARDLQPGPLATFVRWKELGRHVRRGEKALTLCQPVTIKRKADEQTERDAEDVVFTRFVYRPRWFVLSQTDGRDLPIAAAPAWDKGTALAALDIREIPFDELNGNVLGFARRRDVAINPVNPHPYKTLFHELAHVVLGHTLEGELADSERTPRNLREAEAECVALLCCEALGLGGAAESRGYVQGWWGAGNPIPERSAQRVLKTADQILRAGCAVEEGR